MKALEFHKAHGLSVSQAMQVINLYASGRYTQLALANRLGISESLVWRVTSFRWPYSALREAVPPETLTRLAQVKRRNMLCGRGNQDRARLVRRLLTAGYGNGQIARMTGIPYHTVWRIASGRSFGAVE